MKNKDKAFLGLSVLAIYSIPVIAILVGYFTMKKKYKRMQLINPIPSAKVREKFGPRTNPITQKPEFHNGIDLASPLNTPILAPANGLVFKLWTDNLNGNAINILHDTGLITGYAHLNSFAIKKGDRVTQGQIIGYVGTTGQSTGPHLHFVVKQKNPITGGYQNVNPLSFIKTA